MSATGRCLPHRATGLVRTSTGGRRAAWSVLDQIMSSVTNFGLAIVVAKVADQNGNGAFEVAFSVYLFAVGCARALGAEPLLVRHSDTETDDLEQAAAATVGTALVVGTLAGVVCLAAAALIEGRAVAAPLAALGVGLPFLLVQDSWRYVFFAAGRPAKALLNDTIWAVVQLAVVLWLLDGANPSVAVLVAAWGASAGVAAVLGVVQTNLWPRPSAFKGWLRRHRDLVPQFLGEFSIGVGASQLSIWLIGWAGSLSVLGALRAGGVLVGPVRLFLTAAPAAAIPELIRIRRQSPKRFQRLVALLSWGLAVMVAGWTIAIMAVPRRYGEELLGVNWEPGRRIFPLLALSWAALGLATGAMVALRVLADARRSFRARLLICPAVVVVPTIAVVFGDEVGAAAGIAAVSVWSAAAWWLLYRRATTAKLAEEAAHDSREDEDGDRPPGADLTGDRSPQLAGNGARDRSDRAEHGGHDQPDNQHLPFDLG
jgi:O-antigen/teichoic acid export membrane protein